jgi:hypothetical protein
MRFTTLYLSLAASVAIADPASAVLKHYDVLWTTISEFNNQNPTVKKHPAQLRAQSRGVLADSGGGSPVLKRLALISDNTVTVNLFGGPPSFIYLSFHTEEGPKKGTSFTGVGSADTTIAWGLVTGWTMTGGLWCHSDAAFICTWIVLLGAQGKDLATVDPQLQSPFYDLGTWTLHGTGFTAAPFVHRTASPTSMSVGNTQYQLRGRLAAGLVPAVPVLGVALLGASLLFAGARQSRRR